MRQEMTPSRASECVADAAAHRRHNTGVSYPHWYLKRWHFLPEGYLSRRSAQGYDGLVRHVYYAGKERAVLAALVNALRGQAPPRLLDLGCGPGRALRRIGEGLRRVSQTGIDLSPYLLDIAERQVATLRTPVRLVHGDVTQLPFEDAAFDAICASHVIGHLPREAAFAAMAEARRVLAPGGRLYLIDHAWHPSRIDHATPIFERRLAVGAIRLQVFEP